MKIKGTIEDCQDKGVQGQFLASELGFDTMKRLRE